MRVLDDGQFEADKSGHVGRHAGKTVLFSDGSGKVESFKSSSLGASTEDGALPDTDVYTTPEPHHGVAVELEDGKLLVTLGNEESRSGIAVLSAGKGQERQEIVRNEDCPGVHGEAVAAGEAVVVGCENGMLIYKDGVITKVASPDAYGRLGRRTFPPGRCFAGSGRWRQAGPACCWGASGEGTFPRGQV